MKSLALVETANAIKDDEYRKQAVSLAAVAREIPPVLAKMGTDYGTIYGLQSISPMSWPPTTATST